MSEREALKANESDQIQTMSPMKPSRSAPFAICLLLAALGVGEATGVAQEKSRVLVLTDISNEPDDEESLVRFLVYSNEFDVEGIIATTSTWLKKSTREDLIRRDIAAYAEVRANLLKHAAGFPTPEYLGSVTKTGQPGYGLEFVGPDQKSAGSQHMRRRLCWRA